MDKGRSQRRGAVKNGRVKAGETLTETLITMLIIGLSSVLFLTMTGAAGRIFRRAETQYDEIYDEISKAYVQSEVLTDSNSIGEITVGAVAVDVNWCGSTDYVLSYKVG